MKTNNTMNTTPKTTEPLSFADGLFKMVRDGITLYTQHESHNHFGEKILNHYQVNWDKDDLSFKIHLRCRRADGQVYLQTTSNAFFKDMEEYGFTQECPLKPKKRVTPAEAFHKLFLGDSFSTYVEELRMAVTLYVDGEGQLKYTTPDRNQGGNFTIDVTAFNKLEFYEV